MVAAVLGALCLAGGRAAPTKEELKQAIRKCEDDIRAAKNGIDRCKYDISSNEYMRKKHVDYCKQSTNNCEPKDLSMFDKEKRDQEAKIRTFEQQISKSQGDKRRFEQQLRNTK